MANIGKTSYPFTNATSKFYGSTASPITSATAGAEFQGYRTACSATSGNSYGVWYAHKVTGAAGSGASIRGYAYAYGVAAANVYGGEFTGELNSSGSVTGEAAGIRAVMSIQNTTSSGTLAAMNLAYDVITSGSAIANCTAAFISVGNIGSGTGCNTLFNIQVAKGTNSAVTLSSSSASSIPVNDTWIRCLINGTPTWLAASTTAPHA